MHGLPVARRILHPADPPVLGEIRGHDEAAIDVAGARGHRVRRAHLEHVVGRAEGPARREHPRGRQLRPIAFRRAGVDPFQDGGDFRVGQPSRLEEAPESWHRLPRGHRAPLDLVADVGATLVDIRVRDQGKGRVLAWTVARLASLLDDPHDLVAERGRLRCLRDTTDGHRDQHSHRPHVLHRALPEVGATSARSCQSARERSNAIHGTLRPCGR